MRRMFFALLFAGMLAVMAFVSLVAAAPSASNTPAPVARMTDPYPEPYPSPQRATRYLPVIQNGRPLPTPTPTPKPTQAPYPTPRP